MNKQIPLHEFYENYNVVPNSANGNCLFEALCFTLPTVMPECADITIKILRRDLAKTYKELLALPDFAPDNETKLEDELLNKIKLGLQYDDDDDNGLKHHEQIARDRVWASMTDVLLFGYMTQVDIYLLELGEDCMQVNNMTNIANPRGSIMLYYSNGSHFEAVVAPQTPGQDFGRMRVADLKRLCQGRNIEGVERMRKAELIAVLSSAMEV